MKQFKDLVKEESILFLSSTSKERALSLLVDQLVKTGELSSKEPFYTSLLQREKLMSTAIGLGAALPHAKLSSLQHFFLAIGIMKEGITWNVEDDTQVTCIFLIGGPDTTPDEYLALLSRLTKSLRSDDVIKKLEKMKTSHEVSSFLRFL